MRIYTYSIDDNRETMTVTSPEGMQLTRKLPNTDIITEEDEARQALYQKMVAEYEANGINRTTLDLLVDVSVAQFDEQ
jgi:hypothetical protein